MGKDCCGYLTNVALQFKDPFAWTLSHVALGLIGLLFSLSLISFRWPSSALSRIIGILNHSVIDSGFKALIAVCY